MDFVDMSLTDLHKIVTSSPFAIFGAQVAAFGAYKAIGHLYGRVPDCFAVTSTCNNPDSIDGIPVKILDEVAKDALIIIAVTDLLQDEIARMLRERGYGNIFKLTSHEEHSLMSAYYESIGKFPLAEKSAADSDADFSLYEICSHLDKPLLRRPALKAWEVPIQAGASLTEIRVCELTDDTGESISAKNRMYYEASAMYWIWKNAASEWVGIEHYRRHFLVSPALLTADVDAVLSLPYMCEPNCLAQVSRYVSRDVTDALLNALRAICPNEYDVYMDILSGHYFYAYNMMAAKRDVYSQYCKWAFGITGHIEALGIDSIKNTRALSYVVELLTSLYFLANANNLKIRHAARVIFGSDKESL